MATKPKEPQQAGPAPQSPQQGQQSGGSSQSAGQPVFKDWASI